MSCLSFDRHLNFNTVITPPPPPPDVSNIFNFIFNLILEMFQRRGKSILYIVYSITNEFLYYSDVTKIFVLP